MTGPYQQVPNSSNSPAGLGNVAPLNLNGVGNGNQNSPLVNLVNAAQSINLDPFNQPPVMKTLVYSPDVKVLIGTSGGKQFDVSSDIVRGTLFRTENAASTFFCELANQKGQYTKDGGLFGRMDRITVFMKRVNWVQVFSGYLDTVPFAQMWAGNVTIKATCTLKRLLYTYWDPDLVASQAVFNQDNMPGRYGFDAGMGDLLGNLVCWIGGWSAFNVHIQEFPTTFFEAMKPEFERFLLQSGRSTDEFKTMLLGLDHSAGPGENVDRANLSTGPGLGPQVIGIAAYQQQVITAVDQRGMGPSVADIQNAYTQEQLSVTGEGSRDNATQGAFEGNTALGQTLQTQARSADAAILAFACVMAESNWLMYANPLIEESYHYYFEVPGPRWPGGDTGVGLFQQSNGWGTVQQRMNAYASAGMFLDALNKISGWQNMDPATAISIVQKNRNPAKYAPFIDTAAADVQAIRAGQGKYAPQNIAGLGTSTLAGTSIGQVVADLSLGTSGIPGVSQNSPTPGTLPVAIPGTPQPDAQGAVNCALTFCLGRPYVWGAKGPAAFDCSGLLKFCYQSIGLDIGEDTGAQALRGRKIPLPLIQPGDAIQTNGGGHTSMYIGGGLVVSAPDVGMVVMTQPMPSPTEISGIYRYAEWGGPNPLAPFNPAAGPGIVPGTGSISGLGVGSDGAQEPIARNLFSYIFTPANFAAGIGNFFSGEKSFINCQPLMQQVQAVAKGGLRNFCSAPNGDFIAYYPDYFGVDGKPITMKIENIEMKDVRINLSDDALATHVYVKGNYMPVGQANDAIYSWLETCGVATVENESLYQRLKQVVPGGVEDLSGQALLQKYGVRPVTYEFNSVNHQYLEFLVACQLFMQKWAEQYDTTATFTFMPELFPGMRIQLADTGIAVYVHEVTHNFDWEQGFSTQARIMAPSAVNGAKLVDTVMTNVPATANVMPNPAPVPGGN